MNKDYIEELNIIAKTRLFFANHQKLNEFTGLNFSLGNNASKMSFERRAKAFEKLSERANELSNEQLKLEKVIDIYKKISNYITKDRTKSKNKDNIIVENYLDNFLYQGDLSALETAIMVLILLGLLPVANTNKGFDDTESFEKDFEKMFDFLGNYIKKQNNNIISTNPIIQVNKNDMLAILRDKVQEKWNCRFELIYRTYNILLVIQKLATPENRINVVYNSNYICPKIEGIWCVSDHLNTNDFYHIKEDEDTASFWLTHYQKKADTITSKRYSFQIELLKDGNSEILILSPEYQRILLEKQAANNYLCDSWYLEDCNPSNNYPSNDDTIKKIQLEICNNPNSFISFNELYRIKDDKYFYSLIEKSVNIVESKYRFQMTGKLYALTIYNFYIKLLDCDKKILNTNKKYLVLPRSEKFEIHSDINSHIYLVYFEDDAIFLAFNSTLQYYKITDQEVFKELNLKFSDTIE